MPVSNYGIKSKRLCKFSYFISRVCEARTQKASWKMFEDSPKHFGLTPVGRQEHRFNWDIGEFRLYFIACGRAYVRLVAFSFWTSKCIK